jgi:aminoglycoside/choline kinase family phosphotransferase
MTASEIHDAIISLAKPFCQTEVLQIEKIPQSGSDRAYFRVKPQDGGKCLIATYSENLRENGTFIYFSKHFAGIGAPVPEVLAINETGNIYLQQDFGNQSLLNMLEAQGTSAAVYSLYQHSLKALAHLQIKADENLDYNRCITSREFGQQAIMSDLLYFKYYFLDTLQLPYDKEKLMNDFEALSSYLAHVSYRYFMFRDFQSRNIMVQDGKVHFIDFQGGMKGALQYDVASLLWQAKANLPDDWKTGLLHDYMDEADKLLPRPLDRTLFVSQYNGYVLIRLLQVLGAYGFRGLFERKAHFLSSIPLALRNLQWFLQNKQVGISFPVFEALLHQLVEEKLISRFETKKASENSLLEVTIQSFSYIRNGYPEDASGNGGGFVFDMRGILNPGRYEPYKRLSGLDKPVTDFLEQQSHMPRFLNSVFDLVDLTVENYLDRGFEQLTVSFGCTGGQHRSVYAAEAFNRHLRNKFAVKTRLLHLNKENWQS